MATTKKGKSRGLGRGLSALMADISQDETSDKTSGSKSFDQMIPIENIAANPDQPRRSFDSDHLQELADSIGQRGIIQPLIVREEKTKPGYYQIIAGERRWRAAQMAKLHEVPVIVRNLTDIEVLEVAIIENIQRADLNALEEALGYRQLMDRFGHTQEKLAEAMGKSRSYIANLLRLLQLPEDVQELLRSGKLSAGHARALITSEDPSTLAKLVVDKQLSVRETEKLAKTVIKKLEKKAVTAPNKDADTRALEGDLSAQLGMRVSIDHKDGHETGSITIKYKSLEQLDDFCRKLSAAE
ncbi:ParB/RepB/Spo0J family partition protein [Parasulfitobacter algicola]|uniref:ParB/RepB/Spo0J family partition protein n=1 Tax=Parasulfitobacter algicola TaxID=2614809 RepID=A0ABX2IR60_9RHOB|nr:ParB/RepB/Spo0J family partition protein [Sulfitobacter algicola]NSX53575.1 ParB/RepB/Spo0J family partition protein [Sulfitobacter algicola]